MAEGRARGYLFPVFQRPVTSRSKGPQMSYGSHRTASLHREVDELPSSSGPCVTLSWIKEGVDGGLDRFRPRPAGRELPVPVEAASTRSRERSGGEPASGDWGVLLRDGGPDISEIKRLQGSQREDVSVVSPGGGGVGGPGI